MKNWLYLTLSAIIISLALFLRLYHIENRAPFDWDQNRDYVATGAIVAGHPTMVGPVARGDGGFFLGPLYYYLLTPGYLLTRGNPLALPITSSLFDALAIVFILMLFPRIWGKWQSLALGTIWSVSWFAIEASRISWNVSLIPLWTVLFLYLLTAKSPLSLFKVLFLGLVAGLSWHIHAALIPLALLTIAIYFRSLKFSWHTTLTFAIGYLIPLLPLFIFDLRHVGLEHRLIIDYFHAKSLVNPPWGQVLISVFSRLGKNTYAIATGSSNLHLWWGIGTVILAIFGLFKGSRLARASAVILISNVLLALYFRDPGFPEYYLAASYLTMLILGLDLLRPRPLMVPLIGLVVIVNLHTFTTTPTTFALIHKTELVGAIAQLGSPVSLRFDLPLGRDAGISPLLTRAGISQVASGKTQVLVTESTNTSVFVDGEIAKDLGWFGGFRVAYRVVQ